MCRPGFEVVSENKQTTASGLCHGLCGRIVGTDAPLDCVGSRAPERLTVLFLDHRDPALVDRSGRPRPSWRLAVRAKHSGHQVRRSRAACRGEVVCRRECAGEACERTVGSSRGVPTARLGSIRLGVNLSDHASSPIPCSGNRNSRHRDVRRRAPRCSAWNQRGANPEALRRRSRSRG
jgi:hypothetical protein